MTHDHHHSHDHGHDHGHSHTHSHDHHHDHGQKEMTLAQKLETLLAHWVDHNDSHKDNFNKWAQQAEQASLAGVAACLTEAGRLSDAVTDQLKKAQKELTKAPSHE